MRKLFLIIVVMPLLIKGIHAQVINTERMRIEQNEDRWKGIFDFNFGLNRTKAGQTLILNTNGQVEFTNGHSKWMFLSGYGLTRFTDIDTPGAVPKNFNNAQFAHFRYNRTLNKQLTWEAFVQEQWDEIHEIDLRLLVGSGPRIELVQKDSSQSFLGFLLMYELENNSPAEFVERNRDWRLSTYLSAGFTFRNVAINHISYYQPLIDKFQDYRINSESSIHVQVDKRLSFRTSFTLIFDSRPPATVRQTRYNFLSGFSLSF